jgi:hypothetical protein
MAAPTQQQLQRAMLLRSMGFRPSRGTQPAPALTAESLRTQLQSNNMIVREATDMAPELGDNGPQGVPYRASGRQSLLRSLPQDFQDAYAAQMSKTDTSLYGPEAENAVPAGTDLLSQHIKNNNLRLFEAFSGANNGFTQGGRIVWAERPDGSFAMTPRQEANQNDYNDSAFWNFASLMGGLVGGSNFNLINSAGTAASEGANFGQILKNLGISAVASQAGGAASNAVGGGTTGAIVGGAAQGGTQAGLSGQNIGRGAVTGAVTGGLRASNLPTPVNNLLSTVARTTLNGGQINRQQLLAQAIGGLIQMGRARQPASQGK